MCRSDCDGLLDVMFEIAWRDNVNAQGFRKL